MKQDSKLSDLLHILLHMAEAGAPLSSEVLARAMRSNPVVVRRLMAGLREAGFVQSGKGHGGGWRLARPLEKISLRDIHEASGAPPLVAIGMRAKTSVCLVEQTVNAALGEAAQEAEAQLLRRFERISLAQLGADFHTRMAATGASADMEIVHAR